VSKSDLIDLTVFLVHETDKAWLVSPDDELKVWIPKSRGELEKNADGKTYNLTIPESLATEKELI
jgi:hypothetical protein